MQTLPGTDRSRQGVHDTTICTLVSGTLDSSWYLHINEITIIVDSVAFFWQFSLKKSTHHFPIFIPISRMTLPQLWSFKICRMTFANHIEFTNLLILRLQNSERAGRVHEAGTCIHIIPQTPIVSCMTKKTDNILGRVVYSQCPRLFARDVNSISFFELKWEDCLT